MDGAQGDIRLGRFIHPDDRQSFIGDLDQACQCGKFLERRSVRLVASDGRVKKVEVLGEPRYADGRVNGVTLTWKDAAGAEETRASREEIESLHEIIHRFVDSLLDPVVILSNEARIAYVNEPCRKMLGYGRYELVGKPAAAILEKDPERYSRAMIKFIKSIRSGALAGASTSWIGKKGTEVPVTMSGSVIRGQGGDLMGMVLVGRDERENALLKDLEKRNDELARAYDELRRLDRMKDDFLSLVGHELRAPLANILGYAEFLSEWDMEAEEKSKFIKIIYHESQRLTRLVNDILDLSRMEAGRMSYQYVTDSINRVAMAAADGLRADAEKKNVILDLSLSQVLGKAEFDPDRIQQVIANVIHNAIKFTDAGKKVTVSTVPVEDGLMVSVADEGEGIDPADAARVFNKFEQVGDVSNHSKGAGLGMPIAKQIIEEGHGGRMWFESPGRGLGSVFSFTLPERRAMK